MEVVQEQVTAISCLQRKIHASFPRLLNGKMKQQTVAVVADKLCLCRFMILLKIEELFKGPLFLVKVSSYSGIFAFTSMGATLAEINRTDEQLANAREGV